MGSRYFFVPNPVHILFINCLNNNDLSNLEIKQYLVNGNIMNGTSDGTTLIMKGTGCAHVLVIGSFAVITYDAKITDIYDTSASSVFSWGLSRDLLMDNNSNIPRITPIDGGILLIFKEESLNLTLYGLGGTHRIRSDFTQYWAPARVYTDGGSVGVWGFTTSDSYWNTDTRIFGICFGTVS